MELSRPPLVVAFELSEKRAGCSALVSWPRLASAYPQACLSMSAEQRVLPGAAPGYRHFCYFRGAPLQAGRTWTCRFPASGSRTRLHAFAHGTSRPSAVRRFRLLRGARAQETWCDLPFSSARACAWFGKERRTALHECNSEDRHPRGGDARLGTGGTCLHGHRLRRHRHEPALCAQRRRQGREC